MSASSRRVEEEDLPDLRLERIEAEAGDRGAVVGGGNRELELDAVGLARQLEHRDELLVGEALDGHRRSVATPDYAVDVLRLYNSAVSGNCYKVRLLLAHLGLEYETVELSVVDRSNRKDVLGELNPGLRVPTLVLDDGRPLGESNAILWYFGDGTQYVPGRPVRARAGAAVAVLRAVQPRAEHRRRAVLDRLFGHAARRFEERLPGRMKGGYAALDAMEGHLAGRSFLVGERYSLADISLYAYTHVAHEGGFDLEPYPAIRAWLDRVAGAARARAASTRSRCPCASASRRARPGRCTSGTR